MLCLDTGIITNINKKTNNLNMLNLPENQELKHILQKNLYKLRKSIPDILNSILAYKCNSLIPFIYLILDNYIQNNISLSQCTVCNKYFESNGRIGKTGNKYCSKQCSNVIRAKRMRERRARN